jgi:hypothetical protein
MLAHGGGSAIRTPLEPCFLLHILTAVRHAGATFSFIICFALQQDLLLLDNESFLSIELSLEDDHAIDPMNSRVALLSSV